jgi:sugar-specific transcriptional regulator TrmB
MPEKRGELLRKLRSLNLGSDEAVIYLQLLKEPATHLRLSHQTGINRTKVYRVVEQLEKRSLVTRRTDDRGTFLSASDPSALEIELVAEEERLKNQRVALGHLTPILEALKKGEQNVFVVRTYEGDQGLKQMLWNELKAKDETLIFGSGTTEELLPDRGLAEKHRMLSVKVGHTVRELMNQKEDDKPPDFTAHQEFLDIYRYRRIPQEVLPLDNQIAVYNDTVTIYHWRYNQKVGVEIINKSLSQMMRSVFEYYWNLAEEPKYPPIARQDRPD